MNNGLISKSFAFILAAAFILTACSNSTTATMDIQDPNENIVGVANPSSVYCQGLEYSEESVERNGGMDADCIFPDDSRCASWDFLAGRCGQEFTYCEMQGGSIEEVENSNIGTCRFSDGSSCSEYEFFREECSPGDNPG